MLQDPPSTKWAPTLYSVNTPLIGVITPVITPFITRPTLPPMCPIFGWQLLEADLKGIRFFLMQRPILMMRRNAEVQKTCSVDVFTQGNIYYGDYYGMFLGWERSGKKNIRIFHPAGFQDGHSFLWGITLKLIVIEDFSHLPIFTCQCNHVLAGGALPGWQAFGGQVCIFGPGQDCDM